MLWIFSAFALLPASIEDYIIIGAPVLIGLILLGLPFVANSGERSPSRRPWAVASVILVVIMIGGLWLAGVRAPWSPNFAAQPLPPDVVGTTNAQAQQGALLFHAKGCQYCHMYAGQGGQRGPDLTNVGDRLTTEQISIAILNGRPNMPAFAGTLKPEEVNALVAFLQSRTEAITRR
jgi:ubiquinol-cytochrome c reductase cytochrome b subunit